MIEAINAARAAAKKALEEIHDGTCTIIEYGEVMDETTKITNMQEVTIVENQPCRLSFSSLNAVVQTDSAAAMSQGIKLFVSPEITVKPGSKIIVTQAGVTTEYKCSGVPAVYPSHTEIMLELFKGWA